MNSELIQNQKNALKMKIENFEKAEQLKKEFDEKTKQLKEIKDAIDFNRIPVCDGLKLVSFGSNLISWDVLDWRKMLIEADAYLTKEIREIKFKFESLK